MSTAVWSYVPTESVVEEIESAARGVQWLGRPAVYTAIASHQIRRFTLSWGPCVDSTECNSMLAFYRARLGSFDSFVWRSPIDARTYSVRFDSSVRADTFHYGLWRSGAQLAFITTHTPTLTTVVGSLVATEYYAGSGGGTGTPNSGTGAGFSTFLYPDQWYWAGIEHQPIFTSPADFTTNQLKAVPFAITQSGFICDGLAMAVTSISAPVGSQAFLLGLYNAIGQGGDGYDGYPNQLLAATSVTPVASGFVQNSIPPQTLGVGVYWIVMVTSFTGTGTRVRRLDQLSGLITGNDSHAQMREAHAIQFTHSYSLPSTFPSSAVAGTEDPTLMWHVRSVAT